MKVESIESEPTSVLDNRSNTSPPNSASSFNGGGSGGVSMQDLESLSFGGEGSLLPWFMGEVGDPSLDMKHHHHPLSTGFLGNVGNHDYGMESFNLCGSGSSSFGSNCNPKQANLVSVSAAGGEHFGISDGKPQVVGPQFGFGGGQDGQGQAIHTSGYYVPSLGPSQLDYPYLPPAKRHNYGGVGVGVVSEPDFVQVSKGALLDEDHVSLLRKQEQQFQMQQQQLLMSMGPPQLGAQEDPDKNSQVSVLRDQLIKVSEMFQTGNFLLAQVILARLNQLVSLPGKPLVRAAALCVKEELEKLLAGNDVPADLSSPKGLSPFDVIHKIDAFKLFSEVSPVMQFVDFTCTQALLEALDDADTIHLLDFDIGCGSMWASFIRELSLRKRGPPLLKITVFASTSAHHPFELALICDNILEFATECGVSIDVKVLSLDLFDSASCTFPSFQFLENEAVAVNFPISACSHCPSLLPPLLSFVKQCSPKVVIGFDRGGDRCDLAFASHILHSLDSCSHLLESLHGSSVPAEIINKVEKFLIQPSIERTIQGRIRAMDKMHANKMQHWKSLFASAGLMPLAFSNVTEYQAHQVVSKISLKGFHVQKRQESLVLHWQSHELVAALAWGC